MKFQFVDEARKFYRMYSIWAFVALGASGEIYNLALEYGILEGDAAPQQLTNILKLLAFAGALSRLLKQKKLEADVAKLQEQAAAAALEDKA